MLKIFLKKILILIILITVFLMSNINLISYAGDTIDNTIQDARAFAQESTVDNPVSNAKIKNVSNFLFNLFLGVGIVVAVIVGIILGMKYMVGSVEEKAEYKQTLIAYVIGCIVIFGAFGIWRMTVNVLKHVDDSQTQPQGSGQMPSVYYESGAGR